MMERVGESPRRGSGGDWGHLRECGQRPLSEVMSELKFEKLSIQGLGEKPSRSFAGHGRCVEFCAGARASYFFEMIVLAAMEEWLIGGQDGSGS